MTGRCRIELETRQLRCVVHWGLSHGFSIWYAEDTLLDRVLWERDRGIGHLRAVCQRSYYVFPSNKFVNVWACTCYKKYISGIMIVPWGLRLSGVIIFLRDISPSTYTPIHKQLRKLLHHTCWDACLKETP